MTPEKRDPRVDPKPGDVLGLNGEVMTVERRAVAKGAGLGHIRVGSDYIAYRLKSWAGALFYMSMSQLKKNSKDVKVIHAAE